MNPVDAMKMQIEAYRCMTGEQRLKISLDLHELSCQVSRDGIRNRYPGATAEFVEAKLRERIQVGYVVSAALDVAR